MTRRVDLRPPVHGETYLRDGGGFGPFVASAHYTHIYCGICWMYRHHGAPCRHLAPIAQSLVAQEEAA